MESTKNTSSDEMLLTFPLVNTIQSIQGWLRNNKAHKPYTITLKIFLAACKLKPVVENACHPIKSTVLLANVLQKLFFDSRLSSILLHSRKPGAEDRRFCTGPP